jgi:hypothetical protein
VGTGGEVSGIQRHDFTQALLCWVLAELKGGPLSVAWTVIGFGFLALALGWLDRWVQRESA